MADLRNDPIDWERNADLAAVPAEASIQATVNKTWESINTKLFDGVPVENDIRGIEEALLMRKTAIDRGELRTDLDWKHDFELGRFAHRFHLDSLEYVRNKRAAYLRFWTDWIDQSTEFFRQVSLNGQKTIYLLHGAVALGALNILTQSTKARADIVLTAKVGLACSAFGILLAGLGQVTLFHLWVRLLIASKGRLLAA